MRKDPAKHEQEFVAVFSRDESIILDVGPSGIQDENINPSNIVYNAICKLFNRRIVSGIELSNFNSVEPSGTLQI